MTSQAPTVRRSVTLLPATDEAGRVQLAGGVADITTVLAVKIDAVRGVRKPARGDGARDAR